MYTNPNDKINHYYAYDSMHDLWHFRCSICMQVSWHFSRAWLAYFPCPCSSQGCFSALRQAPTQLFSLLQQSERQSPLTMVSIVIASNNSITVRIQIQIMSILPEERSSEECQQCLQHTKTIHRLMAMTEQLREKIWQLRSQLRKQDGSGSQVLDSSFMTWPSLDEIFSFRTESPQESYRLLTLSDEEGPEPPTYTIKRMNRQSSVWLLTVTTNQGSVRSVIKQLKGATQVDNYLKAYQMGVGVPCGKLGTRYIEMACVLTLHAAMWHKLLTRGQWEHLVPQFAPLNQTLISNRLQHTDIKSMNVGVWVVDDQKLATKYLNEAQVDEIMGQLKETSQMANSDLSMFEDYKSIAKERFSVRLIDNDYLTAFGKRRKCYTGGEYGNIPSTLLNYNEKQQMKLLRGTKIDSKTDEIGYRHLINEIMKHLKKLDQEQVARNQMVEAQF